MANKTKKIGPLDVVEISPAGHGPCVVLFHGYGADCFDLTPLAHAVAAPKGTKWYFPNAPLEIPIAPGFMGRAWFPIDIEALERSMRMGKFRDMTNSTPAGIDKSKILAHEFLTALDRKPEEIVIGGFSQGAMLATDIALSSTFNYKALVILSGSLIKASEWKRLAPIHKGMPFFQSHGENDAILNPHVAHELEGVLTEAGLEGHLDMFRGGHEIPPSVLSLLGDFLKRL